jgi:hypothetical protein
VAGGSQSHDGGLLALHEHEDEELSPLPLSLRTTTTLLLRSRPRPPVPASAGNELEAPIAPPTLASPHDRALVGAAGCMVAVLTLGAGASVGVGVGGRCSIRAASSSSRFWPAAGTSRSSAFSRLRARRRRGRNADQERKSICARGTMGKRSRMCSTQGLARGGRKTIRACFGRTRCGRSPPPASERAREHDIEKESRASAGRYCGV